MKTTIATFAALLALSTASFAADAVIIDAPAPIESAYDWSGVYVGVFGGVSTGDYKFDGGEVGGPSELGLDVSGSGGFAGAQIGYDWQMNQFVIGAVADIAWANHSADLSFDGFGTSASAESELEYLGTVRARLGYAAFDRALLYAHGGFAYGRTNQHIDFDGDTIYDDSTNKSGWVLGAGMEYAFTDKLSLQTEYSYIDLGKDTVYNDGDIFVNEDLSFHALKAALNYRF